MARTELSRLAQRWHQLPLDQARCVAPLVHALTQRLLDVPAGVQGQPTTPVPDLGPAVVLDQLTVAVYDYSLAIEHSAGIAGPPMGERPERAPQPEPSQPSRQESGPRDSGARRSDDPSAADLISQLTDLRRAVVAATTRGPSLTGPDPLDHT